MGSSCYLCLLWNKIPQTSVKCISPAVFPFSLNVEIIAMPAGAYVLSQSRPVAIGLSEPVPYFISAPPVHQASSFTYALEDTFLPRAVDFSCSGNAELSADLPRL